MELGSILCMCSVLDRSYPSFMSVLADGQGSLARVAAWRSPRRANVFLHEDAFSLKGDNVTLERG